MDIPLIEIANDVNIEQSASPFDPMTCGQCAVVADRDAMGQFGVDLLSLQGHLSEQGLHAGPDRREGRPRLDRLADDVANLDRGLQLNPMT